MKEGVKLRKEGKRTRGRSYASVEKAKLHVRVKTKKNEKKTSPLELPNQIDETRLFL